MERTSTESVISCGQTIERVEFDFSIDDLGIDRDELDEVEIPDVVAVRGDGPAMMRDRQEVEVKIGVHVDCMPSRRR